MPPLKPIYGVTFVVYGRSKTFSTTNESLPSLAHDRAEVETSLGNHSLVLLLQAHIGKEKLNVMQSV